MSVSITRRQDGRPWQGRAHLSEVQEEAGVLARLREVGEEHRDADEQHDGVLAHLLQGLDRERADVRLPSGCADPLSSVQRPQMPLSLFFVLPKQVSKLFQNHQRISPKKRPQENIPAAALNPAAPLPANEETPWTYREGVSLLPGDGRPPGRWPHLLGQ